MAGTEKGGPPPPYPVAPHTQQYGAPPPGYAQPVSGFTHNQPHIQQNVTVAPVAPVMTNYRGILRHTPGRVTCQFCQADVVTATSKKAGLVTWAACGGIALLGGILGCCLIPFCVDPLKDTVHDCPNCHRTIYTYDQM